MERPLKIIISGGGTGGHIFPAVSIADELKRRDPSTEILFVGALGRMEMERVPAAGYSIVGLPVSGLKRRFTFKNIQVAFNLLKSLVKARNVVKAFKPNIAIGVGGYASGPLLRTASNFGIPTLLQEQNSYAGVTNKLLAKKAAKICVAYQNMNRFFPAEKIVVTGNPVRNISKSDALRAEGFQHFSLQPGRPVLLVVGGSLGARTINEALTAGIERLMSAGIQVIWQTGKIYYDDILEKLPAIQNELLHVHAFVSRMDLAYNVADLVVSRAGAISISEICLTGSASILVPSPNVAEDHQTKNAMALVQRNAALMVTDKEAPEKLIDLAIKAINDDAQRNNLAANCLAMAKPLATKEIVDEVYKIIEKNA